MRIQFDKVIIAIFLVSIFSFGQTVNLTGTVTSSLGAPVSSAKVSITGTNISAVANAQGVYTLTGTVSLKQNLASQGLIKLTPGNLSIQLTSEEDLSIDLIDLSGEKIASLFQGKISAGLHSFPVNSSYTKSSVCLLKIQRNGFSKFYKVFGFSLFQENINSIGASFGVLSKAAAAGEYELVTSADGFVTNQETITSLTGTKNITLAPQLGATTLYYDNTDSAITFSARQLKKTLDSKGTQTTLKSVSEFGAPTSTYIVIVKKDSPLMSKFTGAAIGNLGEQDYVHRVMGTTTKSYWSVGGDKRGAMYGGIHLAEIVAGGSLENVKDINQKPYIVNRGFKFNIPLDKRTPSFDDGGDASHSNRDDMWDLAFWAEYFDVMATHRYNTLTLWNRCPFPSLVHVKEYPNVTLKGVEDQNGKMLDWDINKKIEFWNKVIDMAADRGINVTWVVWNVNLWAAEGVDGLSKAKGNVKTIDYLRKATEQLFLTYPKLWGFGLCAGEEMNDYSDTEKEQFVYKAYGLGIQDVKAKFPNRYIHFMHRNWLTSSSEMEKVFSQLPDQYDYSTKYCQARLYAVTNPNFATNKIRQDGGVPASRKAWWEMRQDDLFHTRWGDPDFVKEMILNFPHESKPCSQAPCITGGYIFGSDRFFWAREHMSKSPQTPLRQLETQKHWYSFLLWGRLGYDPNTSHELLKGLIKYRFPATNSTTLFNSWQSASKLMPMIARFHFLDWDYKYYAEMQIGNEWAAKELQGYHTVNLLITNSKPHELSGYVSIKDFMAQKSGTSPLVVADSLANNANNALSGVNALTDDGNNELKETLSDIKTQSYFGLYWAYKIRGGVSIAKYLKSKNAQDKTDAIAHLTRSLEEWKKYANQMNSTYIKSTISGFGMFDLDRITPDVEKEISWAQGK
jgi:hypothetical protein